MEHSFFMALLVLIGTAGFPVEMICSTYPYTFYMWKAMEKGKIYAVYLKIFLEFQKKVKKRLER